jgi:hypothetical protein
VLQPPEVKVTALHNPYGGISFRSSMLVFLVLQPPDIKVHAASIHIDGFCSVTQIAALIEESQQW